MKGNDIATMLWAIDKSLQIMIREIDKGKPDLARERAEITRTAIGKVLGVQGCPITKRHGPHAAIV